MTLTSAIVVEMEQTIKQMGASGAALIVPAAENIDPERWQRILTQFPVMQSGMWDVRQPEELAAAGLRTAGIPVFSLTDAFSQAQPSAPPLYLEEDGHWTAAGHALAALVARPARTFWQWFALLVVALLGGSVGWAIVQTGPLRWLRQMGAGLSTTAELFAYMTRRRQFALLPLLVILLAFAGLLILAQASVVGPFIYTLI